MSCDLIRPCDRDVGGLVGVVGGRERRNSPHSRPPRVQKSRPPAVQSAVQQFLSLCNRCCRFRCGPSFGPIFGPNGSIFERGGWCAPSIDRCTEALLFGPCFGQSYLFTEFALVRPTLVDVCQGSSMFAPPTRPTSGPNIGPTSVSRRVLVEPGQIVGTFGDHRPPKVAQLELGLKLGTRSNSSVTFG